MNYQELEKYNNLEIWKKLDEGLKYEYSISNTGKLRADSSFHKNKKGTFLGSKDTSGYLKTALTLKNGNVKNFKIHRLVAKYFINENIEYLTINHKDFNKQNNNVKNLEIMFFTYFYYKPGKLPKLYTLECRSEYQKSSLLNFLSNDT